MTRKEIIRYAFASLVTFFSIGLVAVVPVQAQGNIGDILKRMDTHNKNLSSLSSEVTMVKYDAVLEKNTDINKGTTSFIPKDKNPNHKLYARIDWLSPLRESILVIGDEYKIYREKLNQLLVGKTSGVNSKLPTNVLSVMTMPRSQLKDEFEPRFVGAETLKDGTIVWHLLMTPKKAAGYKSADLWVDQNGLTHQAMITQNNGDTSTILLTKIAVNGRIDANAFKLNPKGATIVNG